MPATYTTSLRLVKPATGDTGWGTTVNGGLTDLVDFSVAGTASITMTATDYTLSNNNGATDEARAMFLTLTGTPGASYNVICPTVSKLYFVTNNTGYAQTVKTSGGSGISVPNNETRALYCNGTNVVNAINSMGSLSLGSALGVASGGTGQTTIAAKSVFVANALDTFTALTPAAGQSIRINAGNTAWEAYTPATGDAVLSAANAFTGANTFYNSTGQTFGTGTSTEDGIIIAGRAGGSSSYRVTLTPTTLGANRTLTLPDASTTVVGTDTSQTLTNKTIEAGTFTNGYTEETVTANTGTAYTIDLANGSVQILTLTGNCVYTFPTVAAGKSFLLIQKQDGTGGRTVTWPSVTNPVKWPAGTAPTLTSTASKSDVFAFTSDGTNWIGRTIAQNYTL